MTRREPVAGNVPKPAGFAEYPTGDKVEWLQLNRTRSQLMVEIGHRVGFEHDPSRDRLSKSELIQTLIILETLGGWI